MIPSVIPSLQSRDETVYRMQAEVRQAAERLKFLLDYAMLPGMYSHHVQWGLVDFWSPARNCLLLSACMLSLLFIYRGGYQTEQPDIQLARTNGPHL